jgi:ATP-dependent Clp protease ATP-binding subunit ClpC
MSEYMEKHTAARLIGAPPGYVGYEEGGQLTEKIRRKPYSVILFDEMEKAHPDVFNVLLQILEDGRLTDGKGRTVDFRNAVVIMTSNVGATFLRKSTLGFGASGEEAGYEKMKERVLDELKRTFRPEFLNRVDDIIVFHALNEEHISQIVGIMLAELNRRIAEFDLKLEVSEPAKARLVKEGYDPSFGARPLRRVIQKRLEDGISEEMLQGKIKPGNTVFVDLEDGQFSFRTKSPQKTQAQKTK